MYKARIQYESSMKAEFTDGEEQGRRTGRRRRRRKKTISSSNQEIAGTNHHISVVDKQINMEAILRNACCDQFLCVAHVSQELVVPLFFFLLLSNEQRGYHIQLVLKKNSNTRVIHCCTDRRCDMDTHHGRDRDIPVLGQVARPTQDAL